jgi:hypothetical protein
VNKLLLLEMFPDVDEVAIHAQLVECGDDMQKVADLLLRSQSQSFDEQMYACVFSGDDVPWDYDGTQEEAEEEAQRLEQIDLDHQIATDCQLAYELDHAQEDGDEECNHRPLNSRAEARRRGRQLEVGFVRNCQLKSLNRAFSSLRHHTLVA